jgi:diguanylate cyclase (GGDEF)-like protein/PAS domain S-box-containing protein
MNVHILIITALILSAIITLSLAIYASRKLISVGSTTYMLLMISNSIYSLGYAFELVNDTVSGIFLALKIEYLGIVTLPVFWVILALKYTGYDKKINKLVHFLLFIIPLSTLFLLYTNNFHHLYYSELGINLDGPFPLAAITKGIWYSIHIGYTNILLLSGTLLFIRMVFRSKGTFRKQALMMLSISLIPWVGHILYLMGHSPFGIDLNPFFLTITGPLFAVALFRYGMFNITPIARDTIFEEMRDPVIVLDSRCRIADFNKSVLIIYPQFCKEIIGSVIDELIPENRELLIQIHSGNSEDIEFIINNEPGPIYYKTSITELFSYSKKSIGKIITFHDISTQKKMQQKLHNLAITDELTQLYNRRYFINISKNELKRARRYKRPVSLLIIDIDFFKRTNDNYGHQAGDEILIKAAGIFTKSLRDNDIVARYGGEEFSTLLPEIGKADALKTAERIRENINTLIVPFRGNQLKITVSIGISTYSVDKTTSVENDEILLERLLSEADKALYRAKEEGRDRVVEYDQSLKDHLS